MAKPDCDDGWVKLAHELHAALSCAGFNKWESVVIREVLHQIYGPAKRREATISPTDIASRVGTFKESIVRAIRTLKAGGVLRETETGVRFVKDYEAWTWQGSPRLTPSEWAYCRAARPVNASVKPGNESVPDASTECGNESVLASTEQGNESAPVRERIGSPTGTKALPAGNESVPRAHSIERAGLRIIENELRSEREDTRTPTPSESDSGRTGEEHAIFCKVVEDLEGFKETKYLGGQLVMYADTPEIRGYPSWRLFVASRVVQRPNRGKTWDTFCRAAFNATLEEYERMKRGPQASPFNGRRQEGPTNMPPVVPDSYQQTPEQKAEMDAEMRKHLDECRQRRKV